MSILYVKRCGVAMAALATIGATAGFLQPAVPAHAAQSPLTCDIQVSHTGNLVGLKAIVTGQDATSGNYRFRVVSSGGSNSNIDQSGDFSVSGGLTVVSSVSLGGSGTYNARLSVTVNGRTSECSKKVIGAL